MIYPSIHKDRRRKVQKPQIVLALMDVQAFLNEMRCVLTEKIYGQSSRLRNSTVWKNLFSSIGRRLSNMTEGYDGVYKNKHR